MIAFFPEDIQVKTGKMKQSPQSRFETGYGRQMKPNSTLELGKYELASPRSREASMFARTLAKLKGDNTLMHDGPLVNTEERVVSSTLPHWTAVQKEFTTAMNEMTRKIDATEAQRDEATQDLRIALREKEVMQISLDAAERDVFNLEKQLAVHDNAKASVKQSEDNLQKEHSKLEMENAQLLAESLEAQIQAEKFRGELEECQKFTNILRQELSALRKVETKSQSELTISQQILLKELQPLQEEVARLKAENERILLEKDRVSQEFAIKLEEATGKWVTEHASKSELELVLSSMEFDQKILQETSEKVIEQYKAQLSESEKTIEELGAVREQDQLEIARSKEELLKCNEMHNLTLDEKVALADELKKQNVLVDHLHPNLVSTQNELDNLSEINGDLNRSQKKYLSKAQQHALLMIQRIISTWMTGTVQGCFFNFKVGCESFKQELVGLRMLTRIMSAWMVGTVRGSILNFRTLTRIAREADMSKQAAVTQLSRIMSIWMAGSMRGVVFNFRRNVLDISQSSSLFLKDEAIASLRQESESHRLDSARLTMNHGDLQRENDSLKAEIEDFHNIQAGNRSEVTDIREKWRSATEELRQELRDSQRKEFELRKTINDLESGSERESTQNTHKVNMLRTELEIAATKVDELEGLNTNYKNLEGQLKSLKRENDTLLSKLDDAKKHTRFMEAEVSTLLQIEVDLRTKISETDRLSSDLTNTKTLYETRSEEANLLQQETTKLKIEAVALKKEAGKVREKDVSVRSAAMKQLGSIMARMVKSEKGQAVWVWRTEQQDDVAHGRLQDLDAEMKAALRTAAVKQLGSIIARLVKGEKGQAIWVWRNEQKDSAGNDVGRYLEQCKERLRESEIYQKKLQAQKDALEQHCATVESACSDYRAELSNSTRIDVKDADLVKQVKTICNDLYQSHETVEVLSHQKEFLQQQLMDQETKLRQMTTLLQSLSMMAKLSEKSGVSPELNGTASLAEGHLSQITNKHHRAQLHTALESNEQLVIQLEASRSDCQRMKTKLDVAQNELRMCHGAANASERLKHESIQQSLSTEHMLREENLRLQSYNNELTSELGASLQKSQDQSMQHESQIELLNQKIQFIYNDAQYQQRNDYQRFQPNALDKLDAVARVKEELLPVVSFDDFNRNKDGVVSRPEYEESKMAPWRHDSRTRSSVLREKEDADLKHRHDRRRTSYNKNDFEPSEQLRTLDTMQSLVSSMRSGRGLPRK